MGSSDSFCLLWVLSGEPRGRRIHWGSCGFTRTHIGVVRLICVSVGSHLRAQWCSSSFGFASFHSGTPRGRRVHSVACGFTREGVGVVGLIRIRMG